MSDVPLTESEKGLIGQVVNMAARRAPGGVYLNQGFSKSLGCPILVLVCLGEQALTVQRLIDQNTVQENLIVPGTAAHDFANDNGKR